MSQRDSGYERKERDCYETPAWVTDAVVPFLDVQEIWEPAAGSGKMADALRLHGKCVVASDIESGDDFLLASELPVGMQAIVTNPPYKLARRFIEHALRLTAPIKGTVAMLLRTDFDHARTRAHLFDECPEFWGKIVLTKRIKWFEDSKGQPSYNHAWFIWDHENEGAPTIWYAP